VSNSNANLIKEENESNNDNGSLPKISSKAQLAAKDENKV